MLRESAIVGKTLPVADEMPLSGHLGELRQRIIFCLLPMLFFFPVFYLRYEDFFQFILQPLTSLGLRLVFFSPVEALLVRIKVALFCTIVILIPWFIYQLTSFVAPGIKPKEKRFIVLLLLPVMALFLVGVVAGFVLLLPCCVKWLVAESAAGVMDVVSADVYLSFAATLCLVSGGILAVPGLMFILYKVGISKAVGINRSRRAVYLASLTFLGALLPSETFFPVLAIALLWFIVFEIALRIMRVGEVVYGTQQKRIP